MDKGYCVVMYSNAKTSWARPFCNWACQAVGKGRSLMFLKKPDRTNNLGRPERWLGALKNK